MRQELAGHAEKHADAAGLQLQEGRGRVGDFAHRKPLDVRGRLVLGEVASPGIVFVGDQYGLLANGKALELVGAGADRHRHAVAIAGFVVGLRRGNAHEGGRQIEDQVGVRPLHDEPEGMFVHRLDAIDRVDQVLVGGAFELGDPPRYGRRIEGFAIMEAHALPQFEGPAHAIRAGFPGFRKVGMIGLVDILLDQPVVDQHHDRTQQGGSDGILRRGADLGTGERKYGLGVCRSRRIPGSQAEACGQGEHRCRYKKPTSIHGYPPLGKIPKASRAAEAAYFLVQK